MIARRLPRIFLALCLAVALSSGALAQSPYPNRPVKILVGFSAGTAPDLAARILADRFSDVWGTPFVVENVPGAGSNVATERVAKAAPDGYLQIGRASCRERVSISVVAVSLKK